MTREEAIDILFGVIAANSEEENEALDMAIEALKAKTDGDIISRQDAIDAIRNAEVMIAYDSEWSADILVESVIEQTRDCGCANVKLLPSAEPKTGWIPVSERLPEKDGSYLVCMNWDYCNMNVLMWADGWNCIRRINGKVDRKSEIDGEKITAWMPLPKPYKGGENE